MTLSVTRTAEYRYVVTCEEVEWHIEADTLSPTDPERRGVGQFRLRRAYWVGCNERHSAMACGQCNVLDAVSIDGITGNWAGGGHGYDGDQIVSIVELDGIDTTIPVGGSVDATVARWTSATTLYVAPSIPVQGFMVRITVDADGLLHGTRSIALVDHHIHTRYEGMLSSDVGDTWDAWAVFDGTVETASGQWSSSGTPNSYAPSGDRAELYSSLLGLTMSSTSQKSKGGWTAANRSDGQKKLYHRTHVGPEPIAQGTIRETAELFRIARADHGS